MTELTSNMGTAMDTLARDAQHESVLAPQPSQTSVRSMKQPKASQTNNAQQTDNARSNKQPSTPALHETVFQSVSHYLASLGENADSMNNLYAFCMDQVEPSLIKAALEHCNYNQSQTAQLLGINRGTLRKKCKQYDLCPDASDK